MAKKPDGTVGAMRAKKAGEAAAEKAPARTPAPAAPSTGAMVTCSVHIGLDMLTTLRLVATRRAALSGFGRHSVSDVVRDLLEAHRDELEREAAGGQ